MVGLNLTDHIGELETDDGVLYEGLAEGSSLMGEFHALFDADSAHGDSLHGEGQSFVVEVVHDVLESEIFLSDEVLNGDVDIFEDDEAGSGGPLSLDEHLSSGDSFKLGINHEETDSEHSGLRVSDNGGREIVAPDSAGDPLLSTVNDVEFPTLRLDSSRLDIGDITSCPGFGDSEAGSLLSREALLGESSDVVASVVQEWGDSNCATTECTPDCSGVSEFDHLLGEDESVEGVELFNLLSENDAFP